MEHGSSDCPGSVPGSQVMGVGQPALENQVYHFLPRHWPMQYLLQRVSVYVKCLLIYRGFKMPTVFNNARAATIPD